MSDFVETLHRYPEIDDQELSTLVETYPRLRILDIGLMTTDAALLERLTAFRKDHAHKTERSAGAILGFLLFPAAILIAATWFLLAELG